MDPRLQGAADLAELWEANIVVGDDGMSFIASFSANEDAELFTKRVNQMAYLAAYRSRQVNRGVRVELA